MGRFQISRILVIPFVALSFIAVDGFAKTTRSPASDEDGPVEYADSPAVPVTQDQCQNGTIWNGNCVPNSDMTGPLTPAQESSAAAAAQACKSVTEKYLSWLKNTPPEVEAGNACQTAKKKEEDKYKAAFEKAKQDLNAGENNNPGYKQACEFASKSDKEITEFQKRYMKKCREAYEKADKDYRDKNERFQAEARAIPNCLSSSDAQLTLSTFSMNYDGFANSVMDLEKSYKTTMAKLEKNSDQTAKCDKVVSAGTIDEGDETNKGARSVVDTEETTKSGKKDEKPKSSSGMSANSLMGLAGTAMSAMMGLMNQQAAPTGTLPVAGDVAGDSCMRPENFSNTACKCYLTGDCRNGEVSTPATIGALPGSGGAILDSPSSSTGADLNLGGAKLDMPPLNPNHDTGGGGGGGFGGGGGGGFGGGGGGPRNADSGGGARPRSGLSADILSGVRSGGNPAAGLALRSHPGFAEPEERAPKKKFLTNTPTDLKQFMPTMRETAAIAQPVAISAQAASAALMHPANSNIFVEMNKAYHAQQATLINDI